MALLPTNSTASSLRSPDGIITTHTSIGRNGVIRTCILIVPHNSDDIRILRTTYFPLHDSQGNFMARHESSQIPVQVERSGRTPFQGVFMSGTPERRPEEPPSQKTPSAADNE